MVWIIAGEDRLEQEEAFFLCQADQLFGLTAVRHEGLLADHIFPGQKGLFCIRVVQAVDHAYIYGVKGRICEKSLHIRIEPGDTKVLLQLSGGFPLGLAVPQRGTCYPIDPFEYVQGHRYDHPRTHHP